MAYNRKDYFFKKAKKEGFAARSIFKLEELDQKYHLIQKGNIVLDLGAAPGSWSQYVSKAVGPQGKVLGIDLQEIRLNLPNAVFLKANLLDEDLESLMKQAGVSPPFHAVLSDMAPKTTGIKITDQARSLELCEMAFQIAKKFLKPQGHFVCKLFHNAEFESFRASLQKAFKKVEVLRPKSTRKESKEIFLIGLYLQL